MQMVFQDPQASLNSRMTVGDIVAEPLVVNKVCRGKELEDRVVALLEAVGLRSPDRRRYPHAFSGGQRQRIGIARALALNPDLIVADEPVSALDISVQAQVLNLLKSLQEEFGTAFLFVSHDLGVVRFFCDRVSVLYLGETLETGVTQPLLAAPEHPYTRALASSVPTVRRAARRDRIVLHGELPSPENPPPGCSFHPRCPERIGAVCSTVVPMQFRTLAGTAKCHLLDQRVIGDLTT
jgi:oligopeptide/dipeptide ABC transporter ATP-binding protein